MLLVAAKYTRACILKVEMDMTGGREARAYRQRSYICNPQIIDLYSKVEGIK
jgi:hypothetical protein